MADLVELFYENSDEMLHALSQSIATRLQSAIDAQGKASLMVSGGSTPRALFQVLCMEDIDWDRVTIGLVDDRWLPPDHPDSNEKLVRDHLLKANAASATFVPMYIEGVPVRDAAARVGANMRVLVRPFTVCMLGMGDDGHTASLHPCSKDLVAALTTDEDVIATTPETAPHDRMTLSLKGLMNSEEFILLIAGRGKMDVYRKALSDDTDNGKREMPIRYVLQQDQLPVSVYWMP
jgi:6-phosphogluconolactonase